MKKIAILGSTGSIGRQTLDVAREQKDIEVTALCARKSVDLIEAQIREAAKTGDRHAIAAYLGKGNAFADAMTAFAGAYADQNQIDYEMFLNAIN